ncbi:MAG: hypothetical protein C0594_03800 [Marinilabiliales bacterium]|nr:MAG: hypothetical protein C0594_03800 [Marinilabiliales bacterium]
MKIYTTIALVLIGFNLVAQNLQKFYDKINYADQLMQAKEYEKSIDEIDEILEEFTFATKLYLNRGYANLFQNKHDEAIADFKLYHANHPEDNREFIYFLTNKQKAAELLIENYNGDYTPDPDYYYLPVVSREDSLKGGMRLERACFDVNYYDLKIHVYPETKSIEGINYIHFNVLKNTDIIQLDLFQNYSLEVRWNDQLLEYTRDQNAVFVKFPEQLHSGEKHIVSVKYQGKPTEAPNPPWNGGFVWKKTKRKDWIGVACEHLGASSWWPCKDHLSDKPDSLKIRVYCPDDVNVVANGNLINQGSNQSGENFYDWFVSYPINTYNVTFYIGDFINFSDTVYSAKNKYPIDYYILPQNEKEARTYYKLTTKIFDVYNKIYGIYPYWKDGAAMVEAPYTGMEHQSAIAIGDDYKETRRMYKDKKLKYLVVHEAAHEWWGNTVAANDMADIWISETFATYSELLIQEELIGYDSYLDGVSKINQQIYNLWPMVGRSGVNDNTFASGDIYHKGASMIHNFRCIVNDDAKFKQIIKDIYNHFKFQTINTKDFLRYIDSNVGEEYLPFFKSFLYRHEPPKLLLYTQKLDETTTEFFYKWSNVDAGYYMPFCLICENNQKYRLTGTTQLQKFTVYNSADYYIPTAYRYDLKMPKNSFTYFWIKDIKPKNVSVPVSRGSYAEKGTMLGNSKHGKWYTIFANGNIRTEENYYMNRREGTTIFYNEKGDTLNIKKYTNDTLTGSVISFNNNKRVESGYYDGNIKNGPFKYYFHDTCCIAAKGELNNNIKEGIWKYYNKHGNVCCKIDFHNGEKTDIKYFNNNGDEIEITDTISFSSPMPCYKDGIKCLYDKIYQNIKFSSTLIDTLFNETIYISLVISPFGEIVSAKTEKSSSKVLADEIIAILFKNNDWIPGYLNRNPAYVKIVLPVKVKAV